MAVFYDDFQRADGSLGTGWGTPYGSPTISGGYVVGAAYWVAITTAVTDTDYQEVTVKTAFITGQTQTAGPLVKGAEGSRNGYWCLLVLITGTWYFRIYRRDASTSTVLAETEYPTTPPYLTTMHIIYDAGDITATVDGAYTLTATDSTYALNTHMGIVSTSSAGAIADFRAVGTQAAGLTITPETVGNYGQTTEMAALGTSTAWTSGTPGSPAFTVDHGTISNQEVIDTTHATFTYDPGDYLGYVTFTDPSTASTAIVLVTSNPQVVPPDGSYLLSPEAIAYLHRSAIAENESVIANRNMEVDGTGATFDLQTAIGNLHLSAHNTSTTISGEPATARVLDVLWRLVNGGYDPPAGPFTEPTSVPLAHALDFLRERWATAVDPWTVDQLVAALGGDPLASHQDILTAIDGLEVTIDDTAILEAIAGVKGDPLATIKAVLDYLFAMRTVSEWTLGDVKTWIEAVRGTDQPTIASVMAKLALIQSGNLPSLNDIDEHVSTMAAVIAAIELVTGDILDGVTELLSRSAAVVAGHPVWPGVANATVDTPVSLSNGLTISGPFDGLIVTITDQPPAAGRYVFGSVSSWMHAGAVVFITDDGQQERAQTFGLDEQILVPLTMMHADSAILRLNAGWVGTVAKWSVNA